MSDQPAPVQPSAVPARPLSSQEYLEQLRQRRMQRSAPVEATIEPVRSEPAPAPTTPTPPLPEEPREPMSTEEPIARTTQSPAEEPSAHFPGVTKPLPEETVFTWTAASRPFKKRDRQYYTTIAAIVFLVSLILFFAGQLLPIAVVISVAFLAYVLSSVPPEQVPYKITTYGIRVENSLYFWEEMGRFWFEQKLNQPIAHVEIVRFPGRLTLVLGEATQEELRAILSEVLLEEKPKPTFFDKAANWLQEKIPLEVTAK